METEHDFEIVLTEDELQGVGSIGLAYVGDAVFELLVRSRLCRRGPGTVNDLHRAAVELVCAESQAKRAQNLLPLLTKEEAAVYKRGRNAQVHHVPSHASRAQYGAATAVEALFGWLWLRGEKKRIEELFHIMMED